MNNKKYKIIIVLALLTSVSSLLTPSYSFAVAAKPSPIPSTNQISSDSADLEKIQKIKDIVASKVAKLKLVEKRGIIGKVREVSSMRVVITDIKGDTRQIDVDELTKFNLGEKDSEGISDLVKGTTYSFVGLYNKDTKKLLARDVNATNTVPVFFEGAITSVNDKDYQVVAVNSKGEKKTIDIQSSTKTSLATTDGELLRSGFSKININERILAVGFWDKKDANLLSAVRVIHFSDIPPSKEMQSHVTTASESAR